MCTPQGYYNIERMLEAVIRKGAKVKICGSCIGARGIEELKLIEGLEASNRDELANRVVESDKVLTF